MVTHAEPPSRTPEQRTSHSIVVGVDSRGRSVSALVWAVDEAERTHRTLTLLSARSAGTPRRRSPASTTSARSAVGSR